MMQTKTIQIVSIISAALSLWAKADVGITYSPAQGIGAEAGVMRRDPIAIIRDGDQFYVW